MSNPSLSSQSIIQQMQELVPPGSPEPQDASILARLRELTADLIRAYKAGGRLQEDPFFEAWTRPLHLYEAEVRQQLAGRVVLVTGGEGYVGQKLIQKLVGLGVDRIVSVDNARCTEMLDPSVLENPTAGAIAQFPNVVYYAADIRDYSALQPIMATEQPSIVFHLAAQRHPGLAEKLIRETVTSNVFGTRNIIRLCEEFEVQQCVFSSTGKASRYWTTEVYAASKKMAEWMFAEAAQQGRVKYGMVRFTHMLENSSMCQQIDEKIRLGKPVNIHAPDRYVAGQNVGEAVHLLLNGLVLSERDRLKFLLVRNLGWPTESLEVALHKIMQSGRELPIYFQGILPGYEESFFLGQVDWDDQIDINTLISALETSYHSSISSSDDMIVAELVPFSVEVLHTQLVRLDRRSHDPSVPETALKQDLGNAVRELARSTFDRATPQKALKILRWGVNPKRFQRGELQITAYQEIVEIIVRSLVDRLTPDVLQACNISQQDCQELLDVLDTLPSLRAEVDRWRATLVPLELTPPIDALAPIDTITPIEV